MFGSRFSCLATLKTQFQITIDKLVLYQKASCYKGNELLIEDGGNAPLTIYAKACPGQLFKHELEDLKQKVELTNMDWYAMKRF